ncbi:MAG: DUF2071 domain-containing protein [Bacteroidota bacterium]
MSQSVFLRAKWQDLILANYEIDPSVLRDLVPAGTELDIWEGKCYVSLVGFMFLQTRVKGVPIPFHQNFEEVNLRFYVKCPDDGAWKRGVVFVKELVPKTAIALVAQRVYNEPYEAVPMRHQIKEADGLRQVAYEWKYAGKWNRLAVSARPTPVGFVPGSKAEFITEHYWGYTRKKDLRTAEYQVEHPAWEIYPVENWDIACDAAQVYGPQFADSLSQAPASVFLAKGSDILVRDGQLIA